MIPVWSSRFLILPINDTYALGWEITGRGWGGGNVMTHGGSNGKNFLCSLDCAGQEFCCTGLPQNIGGEDAAQGCDEACGAMIEKYCNKQEKDDKKKE